MDCFAASRRAVAATFGAAADQLAHELWIHGADGDVVHEEQRPRALHQDVVDAVVDEVLADGVVDTGAAGIFRRDAMGTALSVRPERGPVTVAAARVVLPTPPIPNNATTRHRSRPSRVPPT